MSGMGWMMSLMGAVVVGCAILAAMGFKGRVTTIGVDLGTTFSVVGISVNGKVTIITDKQGRNIHPSVVSYYDHGKVVVGYAAVARLSDDPLNTIFNSKRFLGRSLNDTHVQDYAKAHPFSVVQVDEAVTKFGEVGFRLTATGHGPQGLISAESVGTKILKHLLELTSVHLGHRQVNKAIIAVPAKFGAVQRAATAAAYKAAGLKVIRVLEEPTAAAVAYKLHKKSNVRHILVYDFGGGTLDVSLLFVHEGSVQVYATDGDETLGGSDLDLCLFDLLRERVSLALGDSVKASLPEGSGTAAAGAGAAGQATRSHVDGDRDDLCLLPALRSKAEAVKKALSSTEEASFSCSPPDGDGISQSQSGGREEGEVTRVSMPAVSFSVTRQDFETTCDALFERAMLPVTRLLTELDMSPDDVDEVVLVGGTTRIPRVKQQLREFFGKPLNDHIDPDITVAYGAASVLD